MSSRRNKGGTYSIPTRFPVLVTGANGYLAGVLIRDLLQAGLTVHGTVRDLEEAKAEKRKRDAANKIPLKPKDPNAEKKEEPPVKPKEEEYPELYALEGAAERLHLFEANLLKAGSFADAIEGCRVVFHVASPHILPETPNSKEAYKEVVAPAVKGTKNVFNQAKKTPSVKRIVLTSCYMAMMSDVKEVMERDRDESHDSEDPVVVDESFWNETASLSYLPCAYGKTEAEKDAWLKFEKQDQWDLITICPGVMMGPGVCCVRKHANVKLLTEMTDGTMKGGVAPLPIPACVDVRDVSRAHIAAAFRPKANGRYLLCPHLELTYWKWLELIRNRYPEYASNLATSQYSKAWCMMVKGGFARKYVGRQMLSQHVLINSTRSERELGIEYRPWEHTLFDMMEQIIDDGLLDPAHMAEEKRLAKEEEERIKEEKKEAKAKRKEARLIREAEEKAQAKEGMRLFKEQKRLDREAQKEEKRREREERRRGEGDVNTSDNERGQQLQDPKNQEQAMGDDAIV